MNLFVIHRFKNRRQVKKILNKTGKQLGAKFNLALLDSTECNDWKEQANVAISSAEAVIVYDRKSCEESENAKWEIKKAEEDNVSLVDISPNDSPEEICSKLKPLFDFKNEFDACFKKRVNTNTFELYKLMVESSESLIQRRQRTNAFFITVIGSLLAVAGLIVQFGMLHSGAVWLLYGFPIVGLLLCHSWGNLIENYGKLNKAKFDVIMRLEQELDAKIYTAEWVALGKGLRPSKYRSFTATEKNVPSYFKNLIVALTVVAFVWHMVHIFRN